jgi:cell wall-associated NlpC family hydrolase
MRCLYFPSVFDYIALDMVRNYLYLIAFCASVIGCAGPRAMPESMPQQRLGPPSAERSEALLQAVLALGADYRYGGDSPTTGYDCSGLVAHVFEQAWGLELPHNARAQSEIGTPVSLAELQPGDLVFFDTQHRAYSHVGIYLGNGRFVHAPKTGARVRVARLQSSYWMRRFDGARRLTPPDLQQVSNRNP